MTDDTITGGCLCGAVRYTVTQAPLIVAICHCRHCQRQSGSAFAVVGAVPEASYRQTGTTRVYHDVGETGQAVDRHFCDTCGSPIVSVAAAIPGLTIVKAGTLDAPERWEPTEEAYCDSAVDWLAETRTRRQFARSNVGGEA